MSITINTSEYTKTKDSTIDGVKLTIRPMSSAETISLMSLGEEIKEIQKSGDQNKAMKSLDKLSEMYFKLYNDPKKAKELLSGLGFEDWFDIYTKVMNEDKDGESA